MPNTSSVVPWALTMPAGSFQQWNIGFTYLSGGFQVPYPIAGLTWEYVARATPPDLTPGGLFSITTTPSAAGVLVVTATATLSQVQVNINPVATVSLAGEYWATLWAQPNTSTAFAWLTGPLLVEAVPQP